LILSWVCGQAAEIDSGDGVFLGQDDIALLGQLQASAEGAGLGGVETKGRLGRLTCVCDQKLLGQKMSQKFAVPALPQDPQDAVAGLRDRVEVCPVREVAGDGIKLLGVILEQGEARPKEGDHIDLVFGLGVNPQSVGRAPREDILTEDGLLPEPGSGGPHLGQVIDPPQLGRSIALRAHLSGMWHTIEFLSQLGSVLV
jgi:hypothetical protein